MVHRKSVILAAATFGVALLLLLFAPGVPAQQPATPENQEEMSAFVSAFEDVQVIQNQAQAEIAAAETAEAQQEVQVSATEEMVDAVEAQGFTVDRFNALVAGLQADEDFRARFAAELQQ
ncbi:MAG: DUF4168 domain-containing protein [Azospirillaceae bacterium]